MMANKDSNQQVGTVLRCLPDKRVVVQANGQELTVSAYGIAPRPGASVLIANPGNGWVIVSWQ